MPISFSRPNPRKLYPNQTVQSVDILKFVGRWFVQGHTHLWIDRNKPNQIERYSLSEEGQIQVDFSFMKKDKRKHFQQRAWVADSQTNAHWHIQFVYPFWSDYLIVGLDEAYEWTLISVPNRSLMWIMTREQCISESQYSRLVQNFQAKGYPVEKLQRVVQTVEKGQ